jgi:hypothetical protein
MRKAHGQDCTDRGCPHCTRAQAVAEVGQHPDRRLHRELWSGFDGESEPNGLGDGDQRGQARVAMD